MAPDYERRFGGLARLYGSDGTAALARTHVAVAGIGGVGSWCVEALARSGIGALTLIDLDNIVESNVNRQLHALDTTLGQAKVQAMQERIRLINSGCRVQCVEDFVDPDNVSLVFPSTVDIIIDCTDQAAAKVAMILLAKQRGIPVVVCGGAGGKTDTFALRTGDLSLSTNDALLSKLRNVLRRNHGFSRPATGPGKLRRRPPKMKVQAVWFDQAARLPDAWQSAPQGLSCAGYGSLVTVTATMGMAAAGLAIQHAVQGAWPAERAASAT